MKKCHIYMHDQDLLNQDEIIEDAKNAGYIIEDIYKEKASEVLSIDQRPELTKLIESLKTNDIVMVGLDDDTKIHLTRAKEFIDRIKAKGATLCVANAPESFIDEITPINDLFFNSLQDLLFTASLFQVRNNYKYLRKKQAEGIFLAKKENKYKGRKLNQSLHEKIINCRISQNMTIKQTAEFCNCSITTVKNATKKHLKTLK